MAIAKRFFPFVCFVLGFCCTLYSQPYIKGVVVESETKLPIPFTAVMYKSQSLQKGVISDVNGRFEIYDSGVTSINVSCVGYKPKNVPLIVTADCGNLVIELQTHVHEIDAVIVTPKENPAIPIIQNVLRNKESNNFQRYNSYSYRDYFKTVIDLKLVNNANSQDSAILNDSNGLKKQAGFISECVVLCSHAKGRTESKIIAQKTAGFENTLFVQTFVSLFHNSISFYNNSIPLFLLPFSNDKSAIEYVSPLSNACFGCYNFHLQEAYIDGADSVFVINFYPKRGRNFNSLTGTLFISSNGYAIKNAVVEPFEKGLVGFRFRQDYRLFHGRWFPARLDQEIGWVSQKVSDKINAYPAYIITSVIDSVDFSPGAGVRGIHLENVYVDEKSLQHSDSIINAVRNDTLTRREINTYQVLDSVGRKHKFDYWANLCPKFADGKIPVYYFDLDLGKVYVNNKHEGNRLGIGLLTGEKVSKYFEIGGYAGYGFRDEVWKFGGYATIYFDKYNEVQLTYSYQNDLKEAGSNLGNSILRVTPNEYLRQYLGYRFDGCVEHKAEFSFRAFRFFKFSTQLSLKELEPLYWYTYRGAMLNRYRSDEFQFSARYAFREGLSTFGNLRYVSADGNPIVTVTYQRGTDIFNKSSYCYNRYEASVNVIAYNGRVGQSSITLDVGFIDRSLPYGMLFTGEGSWNKDFSLLINNSFQTMQPYEFLSDRYASLFYSHNFGTLLFKTKKFKPQFIVVQNSGWGALHNASDQGIDFTEKDKIYLESGLVINNIVRFSYLKLFYVGFGVGGFYRYGNYAHNNSAENYTLKLTLSATLK